MFILQTCIFVCTKNRSKIFIRIKITIFDLILICCRSGWVAFYRCAAGIAATTNRRRVDRPVAGIEGIGGTAETRLEGTTPTGTPLCPRHSGDLFIFVFVKFFDDRGC